MHGAVAIPDYRHDSYLIRAPGHEYWIDVSTGSIPLHGYVVVVEREAMTQSLGFLDAAAMKQAIDRDGRVRSEEHTYELQSLMRISYAVFGLKKKNNTQHNPLTEID